MNVKLHISSDQPFGGTLGGPCKELVGSPQEGDQVKVTNASGTIVGLGQLEVGTVTSLSDTGLPDPNAGGPTPAHDFLVSCVLPATVTGLPDSNFYSVAIGSLTPVTTARSQLDSDGWVVNMNAGS